MAMLLGVPAQSAAPACDRVCLDGFADRYLAALVAKDAASLPMKPGALFSENLVALRLGKEGLWRTITGRRDFQIRASDPTLGNANWIGIVEEMGKPVFMALRLKIEGGQIAEVETLVGRSPLDNAAKATPPRPLFAETEPRSARSDRATLIRLVDEHWTAFSTGKPIRANYAPTCARFDNGVPTTGSDPAPSGPAGAPVNIGKLGCYDQLAAGLFVNGNRVEPRRVWGVDEERGLVIGLYTPNVPGDRREVTVFGVPRPVSAIELAPFTVSQIELFKIRDRKIHAVEVVFGPFVPFGLRSPFDRPSPAPPGR